MHPRAVAHDDTPRSLRGEGLIAPTTVRSAAAAGAGEKISPATEPEPRPATQCVVVTSRLTCDVSSAPPLCPAVSALRC